MRWVRAVYSPGSKVCAAGAWESRAVPRRIRLREMEDREKEIEEAEKSSLCVGATGELL